MRNYEVVLIIHPDFDETAINGVVEKVSGWITDAGGSIVKVDMWGKRRMAYVINKQREGHYVMITAQMPPAFTRELERNMQITEPVMRYMVTVLE